MYTEDQRLELRERLVEFLGEREGVEGAIVTGSGAVRYRDLLSHTSMLICLRDSYGFQKARDDIEGFLRSLNPHVYLEAKITKDRLKIQCFYEGGLSLLLEVGYAAALLSGIKGACRIVLDKAGDYAQRIPKEEEKAPAGKEDPDEVPFAFFYAIRRCEMGLVRRENIMAERQLSDARKCLLDIQLANEGKNPRFMEYNSLSGDFLTKLEKTYPRDLSLKAVREAEQAMTALYEEIYEKSGRPAWSPEMKYLYDYETNFQFQ